MTRLCFELTLSGLARSGRGEYYAVTRALGRTKTAKELAEKILTGGRYYYDFGDGYQAMISVRSVANARESAKVRKHSQGFWGYEWMVDSILRHGEILVDETVV